MIMFDEMKATIQIIFSALVLYDLIEFGVRELKVYLEIGKLEKWEEFVKYENENRDEN